MKHVTLFNWRGKVWVTISILTEQRILVSTTPPQVQVPHQSIIYSDWNQYLPNRPQDHWDHLLLTLSVSVLLTFFGPLELPLPLQREEDYFKATSIPCHKHCDHSISFCPGTIWGYHPQLWNRRAGTAASEALLCNMSDLLCCQIW